MKYIINLYSNLVANRFEKQYHSPSAKDNAKAIRTLEHYRSIRRRLPMMSDGNHWGNHKNSNKNPYYATQGF